MTSFTKPEVYLHFAADNRLDQRLQSSVCPWREPLHVPIQITVTRCIRLVGHMFSPKSCPFSFGDRHPTVPRAKLTHHPKQHLDRFSRFCMGPKCYAVQCFVNGEETFQNCPFPLGFPHRRRTEPRT